MDGAYLIWDDVLLAISSRLHLFLPAFVRHLLQGLTTRTAIEPENDVDKEALSMWLLHVMNSGDFMFIKDRDALVADVMKCCCLHPGYWTQGVGRKLLEISDKSVQDEWKDLLEASQITSEEEPMEEVVPGLIPAGLGNSEKDEVGGEDEIRAVGGWLRAIAPMSVPIGVVQ
jgi:ribosomal biogenesis protein LAS1